MDGIDWLGLLTKYPPGWRGMWPTAKQRAVFADRSLPAPDTRGEAADQIAEIAKDEGWDE